MQRLTIVGLVLVVLGLAGFLVPRIAYTSEETIIDVGPIQVQAQQRNTIRIPDVASGAAVVAGTVLVIVGATRKP
ncbi:MAG: hypothetical protein U5J97_00165 [Trueperaceae bacterium]|nr:hypothetical protein [Trueperaceae bacterium]